MKKRSTRYIVRPKAVRSISLATALQAIDTVTHNASSQELQSMWRSGELPTGIYDWLIALRKADVAIVSANPRPM